MNCFALVNPGLEEISRQEIKELIKSKSIVLNSVLVFEANPPPELLTLAYQAQSLRRFLLAWGNYANLDLFRPDNESFSWEDFFPKTFSFRIEVENVSGQENRLAIAKKIAGQLFPFWERELKLKPSFDLKKPDFLIIVFFNGKEYFLGLDFCGKELNSRAYRVFPHSASFKGDLAYFFVRRSGFKPKEKLLVGFAKDGALALEAALFAQRLPVRGKREEFSFQKFPLFQKAAVFNRLGSPKKAKRTAKGIFVFDESQPNVIAAGKNARLAEAADCLAVNRFFLDELELKFKEHFFDRLIFQVTSKDEEKLNEILYQAGFLLKPKGTLLLIGRPGWEIHLSPEGKFSLKEESEIQRGDSHYQFWRLERK